MGELLISEMHYAYDNFTERMTIQQWRKVLLAEQDKFIYNGHMRELKAKHLGAGVVEISKKPLRG